MRYYDLIETPKSGKTFLEDGDNRLPKTDERVAVYFQSIDKVKYDRGFDSDGYPILLEYALQEDGTRFSKYNAVADEDGIYQPDLDGIQEDLDTQAKQEADARFVLANQPAYLEMYGALLGELDIERDSIRAGLLADQLYFHVANADPRLVSNDHRVKASNLLSSKAPSLKSNPQKKAICIKVLKKTPNGLIIKTTVKNNMAVFQV